MRIFQLNWIFQDETTNYLFVHANSEKSTMEFKEDCKNLINKYGKEYLNQEKTIAGYGKWIEYTMKKMTEMGYMQIIPERIHFYGSNDIDENELEVDHTHLDNEMSVIVKDDLNKLAIEHNKGVRDHWNIHNINRSKALFEN